jgi:hypothetical protein
MTATTALATNVTHLRTEANALDLFATPAAFEHAQRVAKVFCASDLIPKHLKGNNGADALLAMAIARRVGEDPVMVFQNIYIVHGRAGWSASYMIARANRSGVFKGPIRWKTEGVGDAMKVTAFATLADTGETVESTVGMSMAKAEGWSKNSKYQTMGEHMLRYRSATFLVRLYCPEVMLGMQTHEELVDMGAANGMRDITPTGDTAAALNSAMDAIKAVPTDATVTEAGNVVDVEGWLLVDQAGETVGHYGVTEWLDTYEDNLPPEPMKRERADYIANNEESAKAIIADPDLPEQIRAALVSRYPSLTPATGK